MNRLVSAFSALWLASGVALAQPARKVELELVLAIDCSTSVSTDEYALQRLGLAAAFRHPQVQSTIRSLGEAGMAIAIVQWAGQDDAFIGMPWTHINDAEGAEKVALALEGMKRQVGGRTDIATAINYSRRTILANAFDGKRKTIDVSGDGSSDIFNPAKARDAALAQGITINGLVIYSDEYDLGDLANIELFKHYSDFVIGGPGAFVMEARDYDDFAESIRRKLVREIAGPSIALNGFAPKPTAR